MRQRAGPSEYPGQNITTMIQTAAIVFAASCGSEVAHKVAHEQLKTRAEKKGKGVTSRNECLRVFQQNGARSENEGEGGATLRGLQNRCPTTELTRQRPVSTTLFHFRKRTKTEFGTQLAPEDHGTPRTARTSPPASPSTIPWGLAVQ